jgi:hypothetical protein
LFWSAASLLLSVLGGVVVSTDGTPWKSKHKMTNLKPFHGLSHGFTSVVYNIVAGIANSAEQLATGLDLPRAMTPIIIRAKNFHLKSHP